MADGALRKLDQSGVPLLLARLVLGAVMIVMGWNKIGEADDFLKLLDQYQMFPANWYVVQNAIAVVLPWIEVIGGALLILGVLLRGVSLTFIVLLTGFTIVIIMRAMNIHATEGIPYGDIHFDCGCGSGDVRVITKIPENIGLWLLAWIGLLSTSRKFTLAGLLCGSQPTSSSDSITEPSA